MKLSAKFGKWLVKNFVMVLVLFMAVGCAHNKHSKHQRFKQVKTAYLVVPEAPSKLSTAKPTVKPYINSVWVGGAWNWNGQKYIWKEGYWNTPSKGRRWLSGYWKQQRHGWIWVNGRWK